MIPLLDLSLAALALGLWVAAAVQDLKYREISLLVLAGLALAALTGRALAMPSAWELVWWIVAGAAFLWPLGQRKKAWLLAIPALIAGVLTGDRGAALGLAVGVSAWSLGWWGGADGVALAVLGLRHGLAGVIAGGVTACAAGLALVALRRQKATRRQRAWHVIGGLGDVLAGKPLEGGIPVEREMPAAAALALGGIVMEVLALWQMCG